MLEEKKPENIYQNNEWGQEHVDKEEWIFEPVLGVESNHMLEVSQIVIDPIDVRHDDQLSQSDEQVGPAGGIVIQQVQ